MLVTHFASGDTFYYVFYYLLAYALFICYKC